VLTASVFDQLSGWAAVQPGCQYVWRK